MELSPSIRPALICLELFELDLGMTCTKFMAKSWLGFNRVIN
jgi:hypothetical protein